MDDQLQLVCGETTTEWITSESYERVIGEALAVTAKLIVDAEMGANKTANESAEITRLQRRTRCGALQPER